MDATLEARLTTNRDLGKRFFAEQDRLRGGPAPELCTPDYVAHLGASPPVDRAGHEGFAKAFYAAFPAMRHQVELVVAEEAKVVVRFVLSGTHEGAFFGIPPTGRSVTLAAHVILLLENGKVSELFGLFDEAALLRQLGVLPS